MSTIPSGSMPSIVEALNKAIGAESLLEVSTVKGQQKLMGSAQKANEDGLEKAKGLTKANKFESIFMTIMMSGFGLAIGTTVLGAGGTAGLIDAESTVGKYASGFAQASGISGNTLSFTGSTGTGVSMALAGTDQKSIKEDSVKTSTLMSTTNNSSDTTRNSSNVSSTLGLDMGRAIANNGRAEQEYRVR